MKKIANLAPPVVMTTRRNPLSVALTVKQRDNKPLTQAQDTQQNLWQPDRTEHPLILDPIVNILDPDTGTTISNYDLKWYKIETGGEKTEITSGTAGDDYYKETKNGSLTGSLGIRKNVSYTAPVRIVCSVSYKDNTRGQLCTAEETLLLTSENKPEEFYAVSIQAPAPVHYNPIIDSSSQKVLRASVYRGSAELLTGFKCFWYVTSGNTDTLISTSDIFYVSGQGTTTLTINADMCDGVTITVKVADSASAASPNLPCTDSREVTWSWPYLEALPIGMQGSAVSNGDSQKAFTAVIQSRGIDISDAKRAEYCRLNWKLHPMSSSTVTDLGWGDEVIVPASQLRRSGTENVEVYPDLYLLGAMEKLIDDSSGTAPNYNGYITDDSGSSSASAYGGVVIGRS